MPCPLGAVHTTPRSRDKLCVPLVEWSEFQDEEDVALNPELEIADREQDALGILPAVAPILFEASSECLFLLVGLEFLMCLSFPEWQALYRKYLMGLGMYKPGTTNRMNGNQQPSITLRDSGYISLLRQASIMLAQAYDLRPAHEKDIWDLKLMGATTNPSRTNVRLGFLIVRQEWLRDAAKLYLKYCLPLYSASTCRTRVQSLACFSDFLAEVKPQATAKDITRRLLLDYLNYLQKRMRTGCAKNNVLNLRNFLEMSHREAWLPVGPERLIYDEEVPQPPKPQPRYLSSAVLDQLNRHLDDLRAPWRRMILILQECGMRISELLELPVDCLTQDARGVHYLRYLQGKVSTGERDPGVDGNRKPGARTVGHSARRKDRVGATLPKLERRSS
jgi:integrase/recombinase XerD